MAKRPFLTLLVLLLMLSAAVGITQRNSVNALGRDPEIVSFTAKPVEGQPGSAVLTWKAHSVSVVIESTPEGAGREATVLTTGLGPNGSLTVHAPVTTKYVMRCVGPFSGYAGLPTMVVVEGSKVPGDGNISL